MKTTLSKALVLLLVLLTTTTATMAGLTRAGHRGNDHPARREINAYRRQNVLPVLRQQRRKLEPQLATTDQVQLAVYRAQLKDLRQRGQALHQSFRAGQVTTPPPAGSANLRPAFTEAQQQQLQQLRSEAKGIMLSVAQLAQKYESNIAELAREVQPQKEKWATDMRAIVAKNTTPEQQAALSRSGSRPPRPVGPGRFFRPAMFLLLDPNAPASTEHSRGGTRLYPNPVGATSQLDYTVPKAGPVTVELLDSRGNTLRTVAQEAKQEKGTHTLQTNLSDLPAGTYYYKITTRAGSETKRFVKE